jgi:subtilisin family serine protease
MSGKARSSGDSGEFTPPTADTEPEPSSKDVDRGDGEELTVSRESRERPFLVTRKDALVPAGVAPLRLEDVLTRIEADPSIRVERILQPAGLAPMAAAPPALQRVAVAWMSDQRAAELDALHPQLLVEEDALVRPLPSPVPVTATRDDPGAVIPFGDMTTWNLRVTDPDGTPAAGAVVHIYGSGVPAQGRTDTNGEVSLSLLNETDDSIRALFVNPQRDQWSVWIDNPRLNSSSRVNHIQLRPMAETFAGFPGKQMLGWGQQTMRLDQLDPRFDGSGVTVAVIDSGAANGHRDLSNITTGRDFTVVPASTTGWTDDVIAHGSHCAGVIAGSDNAAGIKGFAPGATVQALRIFPGGRFSSLLDALDYCIQHQIDVVNMSLGSAVTSQAVLQKLAQARQSGVACIVAAGNSGDQVQFPGISPDVLTVAAIGKLGEFPADSVHARQVPADAVIDNGYFSAAFTCHGPEVDVCAPGVAVVSSVPPDGYAAWDGTSMAAPHVAGLAALVLAHHPDFAGGRGRGSAARVDRLFEVIKASATPLDLGEPGRTGAGVPDAVFAVTGQVADAATRRARQTINEVFAQVDPAIVSSALTQLGQQFSAVGLLPTKPL